MAIVPLNDVGKGVNKDLLPADLDLGTWSDCANIRFRNGFAETMGGVSAIFTTPAATLYWATTFTHATGGFSSGPDRLLVTAGLFNVYADGLGLGRQTLTRLTPAVAITTANRVANVVTVTTTVPHNLTTGNTITTFGWSVATFNVGPVAITVTGASTFTYPATGVNGAATGGSYVVNTGSVAPFFVGVSPYRWTGGQLNGVLLINNPYEGMYYWNGSSTTGMQPFQFATPIAAVVRPFKNYMVVLKQQKSISGTPTTQPWNVAWSNSAEPGDIPTTLTASDTNDAGEVDLAQTPGVIVDCLPMDDVNIIYKEDARIAMQFIGGNDIFRFSYLPGSDGLFYPDCVCSTPKGHVFLTGTLDVKIHQGGEATSIAEGRVRDYIRNNINTSASNNRCMLFAHKFRSEVWVILPINGTDPNTALVWNWDSDTWGIRTLPTGTWFGTTGMYANDSGNLVEQRSIIVGTNIGLVESGTTDYGVAMNYRLERIGMHFGDRSRVKNLQRSRWNFDATAATSWTISHGSTMTADAAVSNYVSATYTVGTSDFCDARAPGGKYLAIKAESTSAAKIRSEDLDMTPGGTR